MEKNEFSFRTIIFGILIGVIFLALTMYLDAVAGMDINVSPVATMIGIMIMPIFGGALEKTEVNIMQTCASAVAYSSFALTGNYMARMILGAEFEFSGILIPIILANIIGICVVTLFRNQYVYDEKLKFPQSVMALTALDKTGNLSGRDAKLLYLGVLISVGISLLQNFNVMPMSISFEKFLPNTISLGILIMPLILGIGYVLGSKIGIILLITTMLVNIVEGPLGVSKGWFISPVENFAGLQNFNLPLVIGISLIGALLPLLQQWKTITRVFKLETSEEDETNDIPIKRMLILMIICCIALIAFCNIYYNISIINLIIVLLVSIFFAMLAVRVQAECGLSAIMALNICLVFISYMLTKNSLASLTVPFITIQIAVLAQNTMGDLKTGQVVKSSPRKQIWAQIIGVIIGCIVGTFIFYGFVKMYGTESELFSYPVAHMYSSLADGFSNGSSEIFNFGRFGIGCGAGALLYLIGLPVGAIALCFYLAPSTMIGIAVGGITRLILEKTKGNDFAERMNNIATGFIVGDGIVCVFKLFIIMFM